MLQKMDDLDDLFSDDPSTPGESSHQQSSEGEHDEDSNQAVGFSFPREIGDSASEDSIEDNVGEDTAGGYGLSKPRDEIKVTVQSYQKAADDHIFDVEVEVNGQSKLIHRCYKDLQWLHRNLSRRMELGGYILPPMPAPPPKSVDAKVVVLGETSQALFGDASRLPCLGVEVFLQSLADHRFFSENDTVHSYVAKDQVTERDKLGGGTLWSHLTKAISDYQLGGVEEADEEFSKFLHYVEDLTPVLMESAQNYIKMVSSQQSLACSQVFLVELLKEHSTWETLRNKQCSSAFKWIADGLDADKMSLYSKSLDGRHTTGFILDLYYQYCVQAKEMLYRRLLKLQKLLLCTSKLDKAKPEKKEEAEAAKDEAEKEFQAISETAKREIDNFREEYVKSFHGNLVGYAESQISHSKRTRENLTRIRDQLLDVTLE